MRNSSETDKNKSGQHKVKSRHYKWLLLIAENIFLKNATNFSKYARAYLRKGRYAPARISAPLATIHCNKSLDFFSICAGGIKICKGGSTL